MEAVIETQDELEMVELIEPDRIVITGKLAQQLIQNKNMQILNDIASNYKVAEVIIKKNTVILRKKTLD